MIVFILCNWIHFDELDLFQHGLGNHNFDEVVEIVFSGHEGDS